MEVKAQFRNRIGVLALFALVGAAGAAVLYYGMYFVLALVNYFDSFYKHETFYQLYPTAVSYLATFFSTGTLKHLPGYEIEINLFEDFGALRYVTIVENLGRDEMKRLSPSPARFKILADIIEDCLIEKPAVHVYDMALGDYEYLLHRLRIVTYGDEYKIAIKCPHCGEIVETVAHLEELQVIPFDHAKFEELSTIKLPKKGDTVTLKFQTPRMLDEIEAALDDVNVYRFADYLKKFAKDSQFLVITHRKGTMEAADTVYGITMEEKGISKLLSMKLK